MILLSCDLLERFRDTLVRQFIQLLLYFHEGLLHALGFQHFFALALVFGVPFISKLGFNTFRPFVHF
jgi:hypothetical protein